MAVSFNLIAKAQLRPNVEFEKDFIATVQSFPYLYATDNPKYTNLHLCRITWISIANRFNKTVVECLNKWYSLQQVYIHHWRLEKIGVVCQEIQKWPHYESFKKIEAYMPKNHSELMESQSPFEYSNPKKPQREMLVKELVLNRGKFLAPNATIEDCQKIWEAIATKLNNLSFGIDMPIIKWQKFWKDMKQSIEILDKNVGDEAKRILAFCGTTCNESPISISAALNNDFEFGVASESTLRRCKKCQGFFDDPSKDYCCECCSAPNTKCDICCKTCEHELEIYLVKNWSRLAMMLLPKKLQSYNELSVCINCTKSLKKCSTKIWRACRICETYAKSMESLFVPSKDVLREVLQTATNIKFDETDGLPGYICKLCTYRVQEFNNFYLNLTRVQCHLQEIHATNFVGTPHTVTQSGDAAKTVTATNNEAFVDPNIQKDFIAHSSDVMQDKSNVEIHSHQSISADKVVGNISSQINTALVIGQQRNPRVSDSSPSGYYEHTYSLQTPKRQIIPKQIGDTTLNLIPQSNVVITKRPAPPSVSFGLPTKRASQVVSVCPRESNTGTQLTTPIPGPKVRIISSLQNSTLKNILPNTMHVVPSTMITSAKTPPPIANTQVLPASTAISTNAEKVADNSTITVAASSPVPLKFTNSLAKRIPASQPAVFTISPQFIDSERQEDGPPMVSKKKLPSIRKRLPSPQVFQSALDSAVPQVASNTRPKQQSPATVNVSQPRLLTTAVNKPPQASTPAVRGPKPSTTVVNNPPQVSTPAVKGPKPSTTPVNNPPQASTPVARGLKQSTTAVNDAPQTPRGSKQPTTVANNPPLTSTPVARGVKRSTTAINNAPQTSTPVVVRDSKQLMIAVNNPPQTATPVARAPKQPTNAVNTTQQPPTPAIKNVPNSSSTLSKPPTKSVVGATKPHPVALSNAPESLSPAIIQAPETDLAILPTVIKTEKPDVDDMNFCPTPHLDVSELSIVKVECTDDPEVHPIDLDASNNANQSSPMPNNPSYQNAFPSCGTTSQSNKEKIKLPQPEAPPLKARQITNQPTHRPRKYWGFVNEFQITHEKNAKPTSKDSAPQKSKNFEESNSSVPEKPGQSPQPLDDPCAPTTINLEPIKQEKDETSVPVTFYPDSFELGSVFLTAEDSSMMRDAFLRSELIENDAHSFKYINTSDLMSCVTVDNVKPTEAESTKQKKPNAAENEAKDDVNKEAQMNVTGAKAKFRIRKLKVRIKRNKELRLSKLEKKKSLLTAPRRSRRKKN